MHRTSAIQFLLVLKTISCTSQSYPWMYHQPYGSTARLEPLFNQTDCTIQSSQCYWLLPDKHTRLNYPLSGSLTSTRYTIESNGILVIRDIQASDNGIYHFFRMNNSNWIVSKALLNLRGAPYPSLWLEYWPNVLGGLVAMAVVFITFGLILLTNKYRYRPSSTHVKNSLSKQSVTIEPYHESASIERANPVFINDDSLTLSSKKRTHSQHSSSNSNVTGLRVERL